MLVSYDPGLAPRASSRSLPISAPLAAVHIVAFCALLPPSINLSLSLVGASRAMVWPMSAIYLSICSTMLKTC